MTVVVQERALRTRARIVQAAASVFARSGYDGAAISDILDEAGVTKGALYFHFPSKQAIAEEIVTMPCEAVRVPDSGDELQQAVDVSSVMAAQLGRNPIVQASVRLTLGQGTFSPGRQPLYLSWIDLLSDRLLVAKATGRLLPHARPRETAEFVLGSIAGIQLLSVTLEGERDMQLRLGLLWGCVLPRITDPDVMAHLRLPSVLRVVDPDNAQG